MFFEVSGCGLPGGDDGDPGGEPGAFTARATGRRAASPCQLEDRSIRGRTLRFLVGNESKGTVENMF